MVILIKRGGDSMELKNAKKRKNEKCGDCFYTDNCTTKMSTCPYLKKPKYEDNDE